MSSDASCPKFAVFWTFVCFLVKVVSSVEIGHGGDGDRGDNGTYVSSTLQNVILTLSVLCTLVLVVVGCTWAWWQRVLCFWRKRGTHEAPPEMFVPTARPFTTLDVASLSRDTGREGRGRSSITIDPIPSLQDLGLNGRESFELRTLRPPSIVSVSSSGFNDAPEDVQDWFKEGQANFRRENIEYQQVIGKGWFGKVLDAEALNIRQYVKRSNVIVRELRDNATENDQKRFLSEARMYREARVEGCEQVLKLMGFCVDQMPYLLIFEAFPLGDLKSYLKRKAKNSPGQLNAGDDGQLIRMIVGLIWGFTQFYQDIVRGVKWMQQQCFVHGDLAARNCLVATPAGKVVVGDYGFSTQKFKSDYLWSTAAASAIPIRWAAPETIAVDDNDTNENFAMAGAASAAAPPQVRMLEVTKPANIWSLGVVIWEIYQLGKTPYDNLTDVDVIRRVIRNKGFILEPPQLPFRNNSTKERIYQLLARCWDSIPSHRPSIDEIEQLFTTPT